MNNLQPVEYNKQRILTTKQLAEIYETDVINIQVNFNNNKKYFIEKEHYYFLEGEALKEFKNSLLNDIKEPLKFAPSLYLWTERGASRHCKILDTNRAWEQFDRLEEIYFSKKSVGQIPKTYSQALRLAAEQAEKIEALELEAKQKEQIIHELQPKASYYDLVLQSKSLLSMSQIAKDFGMTAQRLNQILLEEKVQFNQGGVWLLYRNFADKGYTQSKTHILDNEKSRIHTYWTQKGRLFIYDLLKNKRSILPLIEMEQFRDAN